MRPPAFIAAKEALNISTSPEGWTWLLRAVGSWAALREMRQDGAKLGGPQAFGRNNPETPE